MMSKLIKPNKDMKIDILEMRKAMCAFEDSCYDGQSKKEAIESLEKIKECCDNLKMSVNKAIKALK